MYTDVPQFKKCCFCIPLRYGLLTWGYIKLLATLFVLGLNTSSLVRLHSYDYYDTTFNWIFMAVTLLDLGFIVLFIVGAHMKNHKFLRIYYYYSIVLITLTTILFLIHLGWVIYVFIRIIQAEHGLGVMYLYVMVGIDTMTILSLVLQFYLILLIRSEIFKLKSNLPCKFVKVSAPSDPERDLCADAKNTEKVKYDRLNDITVYND